jgi:dynein heavy chain
MVTMIMDGDDNLNQVELDFFLKGNTSLDAVESKKPYDWLTDNSWKDIQRLDGLNESWVGFIDNLKKSPAEWRQWYDQEAPEQCEIPCEYSKKLSQFQILLLVKVVRQDRVIN